MCSDAASKVTVVGSCDGILVRNPGGQGLCGKPRHGLGNDIKMYFTFGMQLWAGFQCLRTCPVLDTGNELFF
jgi:hypothetical protein